jgi:hypothetical protein
VPRKLSPEEARLATDERVHLDEATFRWEHNEDAMATEKLAEGIRPAMVVGALLCFSLRFMAIRRGWRLPVARDADQP